MKKEKVTHPYDPEFWGPHAWRFLYSVALTYPIDPTQEDMDIYYKFFESLCFILPCSTCSENYKKRFDENQIDLSDRESLVYWLSDIHNEINIENKKQIKSIYDFMDEHNIPKYYLHSDDI